MKHDKKASAGNVKVEALGRAHIGGPWSLTNTEGKPFGD